MKRLLIIIFIIVSAQSSFAQNTHIPLAVKSAFEGVWQYSVKYETNTVKIHFEPGTDYALFTDEGSGMAPAKTVKADVKGKLLVISAIKNENDEVELEIINKKLYLRATPILWDKKGNRIGSMDAQKVQRVFKRIK
ncbi:hypothetical protein NAL32_17400 [Chryseobacterium sp. Ch-15]|uniref:DUF4488 domain-containing protein n=1 Tax=Chryseobacterium muglaense TaxID=2893752 RepID=A0A9Q3UZE8_9FLAO|nr:hypothetical protein [Chryseobacterium muglaense]MBD3906452.1 hypothetical protein [Chryseobacterium muglaense]MCC9036836.1 hypothetical protein [Chryseobacterium muglaense]MCM2556162.1 hypothetical protein [Chryseobacterium muglaense]